MAAPPISPPRSTAPATSCSAGEGPPPLLPRRKPRLTYLPPSWSWHGPRLSPGDEWCGESLRGSHPERAAEAQLEVDAVAGRQHARRLGGCDGDAGEERAVGLVQQGGEAPELVRRRRLMNQPDAAGLRDAGEIGAARAVALLHAGLAVEAVVEHDDRQVRRLHHADGGE